MPDLKKLLEGNKLFKEIDFKLHEKEYLDLVEKGQSPKALFIGCSDSRVVPSAMTKTKPGELFIVRNVGNLVPYCHANLQYHEVAAALEFSINVLKVTEIVVCGHSHCGACELMYEETDDPALKTLVAWVSQNNKVKKLCALSGEKDKEKLIRLTERVSVICQIENLLSYPIVKEKVDKNELFLHAWYYKLENGEIEYYDNKAQQYVTLSTGNG